jgi:D-alanyl-D-alanine carboxypeptidase/D-alanyl-D-alanine-endopeptidase (penicillin-binding protein 4)
MADGGWLITGTIGNRARPRRLASVAGDPRAVLAEAWAKALLAAGIQWDRIADPPPAQSPEPESGDSLEVMGKVSSAPLDSLASEINRRSLNIGAELLLQWAGGREGAADQLTQHVQEITGIQDGLRLEDGSGLSAEDRVTPTTFVNYLARFPETPAGRNFPQLLPANGVGTLRPIGSGLAGPGVVHAKTGTLGGVSTLVGYLGRRDGVLLISVMYNGGWARTAKRAQWRLFRLLGADGVTIPSDTTAAPGEEESEDPEQLGGESQ